MSTFNIRIDMGAEEAVDAINGYFEKVAQWFAGDQEPDIVLPWMFWVDTATGLIKQRNGENTDWIPRLDLSQNYLQIARPGLKAGLDIYVAGEDDLRINPGQVHIRDVTDMLITKGEEYRLSLLTDLSTTQGWKYVCIDGAGEYTLEDATGEAIERPTDLYFQRQYYNKAKHGHYFQGKRILGAIRRVDATKWYIINCGENGDEEGENGLGHWSIQGNTQHVWGVTSASRTVDRAWGSLFEAAEAIVVAWPIPFKNPPSPAFWGRQDASVLFTNRWGWVTPYDADIHLVRPVQLALTEYNIMYSAIGTCHDLGEHYQDPLTEYWDGMPLKGQLHCHTTNSDGQDSPDAIVYNYRHKEYDFISITDHDMVTQDPRREHIIYISGVEETGTLSGVSGVSHLTAYDVTDQVTDNSANTQIVINHHHNKGCLVSVAHPEYGNLNTPIANLLTLVNYWAIEIWNAECPSNAETSWDALLTAGKRVYGIATDDTHQFSLHGDKGYVVVYAQEKTKEGILAALSAGNFYASSGNDIGVIRDGDIIRAASSCASKFEYIGDNGTILKTVTSALTAEYELTGTETYVRVRATRDKDGAKAWSQPVFLT